MYTGMIFGKRTAPGPQADHSTGVGYNYYNPASLTP